MKEMRFALPIICIVTFCIVSVMVGDAVIPLGFMLHMFITEESEPITIRLLFLIPFLLTLSSTFIKHTFTRSILTGVSVFLLIGLWLFAIVFFVVYPMRGTEISNGLPAITSIPFLLAAIATVRHSIRTLLSERRLKRIG
jgi:hypothetical protein